MKYCPACRSQYTDPTLRFCLQDGAILHVGEAKQTAAKQSTIDTVSFSDPITADNILQTAELNLYAPPKDPDKPRPPQPARPRSETKKKKSSAKLWLAVFPAVLVPAVIGFGGWSYLRSQNRQTVQATAPANTSTPEITRQAPPADLSGAASQTVAANQPANSNSEPPATAGSEAVKKEIADAVELWRQALEARKVPDYLSKYAEKADYFDKTGAGSAEIRREAQKMFDTYSDIDINLTNVRVAVDPEGSRATAVFDKEWSYHAAKDQDLSEGKARTKLRFQKTGSEWKIISEKYQKVYYTEN
jgi:ketosteroid isomerase-like protein